MLLRYVAMGHKMPQTEEEWLEYREWKLRQLALPECKMDRLEGSPGCCEDCKGGARCTKGRGPIV